MSAAVLAAYLALWEGGKPPSDDARSPAQQHRLLADFRRSEVTAITLARPEATVHIVRQLGDAGEITYSLGDEFADPSAIDKLLGTLEFATWVRRLSSDVDRQALGLVTPREILRIVSGAQTRELLLGARCPFAGGRSVCRSDRTRGVRYRPRLGG